MNDCLRAYWMMAFVMNPKVIEMKRKILSHYRNNISENNKIEEFTEKEVYEIGLSRVSGSGVVYLLYPDPSNIKNN